MQGKISRRDLMGLAGATAIGTGFSGAASGAHSTGKAPDSGDNTLVGAYSGGEYTLPELPYAYDALGPLYEERTLRIHHTKHHAGYVKGLNGALAKAKAARDSGDYGSIKDISRELAFHGSGHMLHCLFWRSMKPGGSDVPAVLGDAMKRDFGSAEACKGQFAAAAKAVEASGWAVLGYEPVGGKLLILQAEKHQNLAIWGVKPLLVCDVWEHAYYLQYANDRGSWVENFMKLANWDYAAERLMRS